MTVTNGMKTEVKQRWIEALRSGQYAQTKGALMKVEDNTVGYCCLGVLCEITGRGTWDAGTNYKSYIQHNYMFKLDEPIENEDYDPDWPGTGDPMLYEIEQDGELSEGVREYFGLSGDAHAFLIDMNDEQGKNFSEIADWIEENL